MNRFVYDNLLINSCMWKTVIAVFEENRFEDCSKLES